MQPSETPRFPPRTIRRVHRLLGLVLLAPLCAWVLTATIFFLKPGYAGAYEMLSVRALPLSKIPAVTLPAGATQVKSIRTILGDHLLIRTADGWSQYDPATMRPRPEPSPRDIQTLVEDAVRGNPRYGAVTSIQGLEVRTSNGVAVTLDWNTLSLSQRGPDTDRIDLYYRIHYLQWTGVKAVDQILGAMGLVLLLALTLIGVRLAFR